MGPNPIYINSLNVVLSSYILNVDFDPSGKTYAAVGLTGGRSRIYVFNADDSYYASSPYSGFGYSTNSIALDSNNYIYIGGGNGFINTFSPVPAFASQSTYGTNSQLKYDPYSNLLYSNYATNVSIYQPNGLSPNLISLTYALMAPNSGQIFDMAFNRFNSMFFSTYSTGTPGMGVEVHNPANSYNYVTTYGSTWGLSGNDVIDVEPISGYLYVLDGNSNTLHTCNASGANHVSNQWRITSFRIRINNKTGKIYTPNYGANTVIVSFDPFAWTSPGTSYLASLPLNQALTLNAGYNLTITTGTTGALAGVATGAPVTDVSLGTTLNSGGIGGVLSLNAGSTLTLAGGTLTPDINQGITLNAGTLVDQFNSTLNFPMTVIAPSTITSNGGNTLKLAGTTTINNTTLTLNGAGITKITGNITGTGTLNVNGNINFANTVMFGGSINLSSGTPSLTANQIWGSIQGSAPLTMNNYMITLGADNTNQTYSGSLTGTGVIYKNGTGIQTLTGNLSGFTGMIVVSHGEVIINSSTPFGGKIINESTINTKNNTVINGDFTTSGTFIVG
jgi:autotransporter-associated beta strand protein